MSNIRHLLTEHLDIWTAADTAAKSGRGRSAANAAKVYGISKLRELILELAVRGKLVPQDTSDEPASELLKRIQAEKAKLIAEGKIKKDKPLPLITNEDKSFDLPKGWAYSNLGDVVEIVRGITFPGSEKSKTPGKGRIACLRTSNVQDQIEWSDILYIREEFVSREDQILMPRDIVMSMANSRELVGKVALVGKKIEQRTSFGGFLGVLRPFLIEPRFVMALLRTPHTREALIDSASQTTNIANISLAKLRPLFFAIPPIEEQHRIVAKVDELMALCDQLESEHNNASAAHEQLVNHLLGTLTESTSAEDFSVSWQRIAAHFDTLFTTEASIDALKQTLLQLAVMGKLVPQDPNDEPASELLKKIRKEKDKLIAEGKIKKDKPLPPITNEEKPLTLPSGWEWAKLGELTSGMDSGWSPACLDSCSSSDEVWGVLKTTSVQVMQYLEYENKELPSNLKPRPDAEVKVGDILFTRAGPMNRVGISCLVQSTRPKLMISDKIIRFHPIEIGIYGRFIALCLNAGATAEFLENAKSGMAASQVNITQDRLRSAPIPITSLPEQHRIVAKVDELMALCDQLKKQLLEVGAQQRKLADVLVKNAVA